MKSKTTDQFWKSYNSLLTQIKKKAKETFLQFRKNPYHPSLHFKRIHSTRPIYSVRITINYRAIGILQEDEIIWFWIGSHSDYENMLKRL